jgi:hypothetical protein
MMFLALCLCFAAALFAQNDLKTTSGDEEMKTLFSSGKKIKLGWFASFEPGYTEIDSYSAYLGGFSGGIVIDHRLSIGLAGRGWWTGHRYSNFKDTLSANLVGGYGGLLVEYTLFPKSLVHLTFPLLIGGGGAAYVEDMVHYESRSNRNHNKQVFSSDAYFVVEPGVKAEINVVRWMRLNAGVSYRLTSGMDLKPEPSGKLSGFNASVGFKFGKF